MGRWLHLPIFDSLFRRRDEPVNKKTSTVAFSNLIGSIIFLVVGIWAYIKTLSFPTVRGSYVQPAAFSQIMLVGMLFFSVVLLIQSIWNLTHLKQDSPAAEKAASLNVLKDRGVQYALISILLCVAYVLLFKTLGYVLVSFLVCFAIMVLIGKRKWFQMILISLLVPLFMWLLFYILLKVNNILWKSKILKYVPN